VAGWRQLESVWMTLAVREESSELQVRQLQVTSYGYSSGYGYKSYKYKQLQVKSSKAVREEGGEKYFSVCVIVCERLGRLS